MSPIGRTMALFLAATALILVGAAQSRAQTETPAAPAPAPAPTEPKASDAFGEEVTMTAKPIVYMKGTATWDNAFETLVDAFKSVRGFLDRENLKPEGPAMTIYLATDDASFQFEAAYPIADQPKDVPRGDLALGRSPEGKALKFVHHGSYDSMDTTYEAITNYLDQRGMEAKELFIEQYLTDPITTAEDKLVVEVFVPLK